MSTRSYSILASLALLSLVFLLFLGPSERKESDKTESNLWNEDWQVIEYYAENNKGPKLRFIRQSGLWNDIYYLESPLQTEQKGQAEEES